MSTYVHPLTEFLKKTDVLFGSTLTSTSLEGRNRNKQPTGNLLIGRVLFSCKTFLKTLKIQKRTKINAWF